MDYSIVFNEKGTIYFHYFAAIFEITFISQIAYGMVIIVNYVRKEKD